PVRHRPPQHSPRDRIRRNALQGVTQRSHEAYISAIAVVVIASTERIVVETDLDKGGQVFSGQGGARRQRDQATQQHRPARLQKSPARAIACKVAVALRMVSSHSFAGTESATTPAPACTWTSPGVRMAVRRAMQ